MAHEAGSAAGGYQLVQSQGQGHGQSGQRPTERNGVTINPQLLRKHGGHGHISLEPSAPAGDNARFPCARSLHTLQATKKQDKEPDKFPSSCRYRIEESKG